MHFTCTEFLSLTQHYGVQFVRLFCFPVKSQIISPHDSGISKAILANLEPWETSWDTAIIETSPLKKDPLDHIMQLYLGDMKNNIYDR